MWFFLPGIHIALFVSCLDLIVSRRKKERKDWILLAYICLLFIFGTVGNALNAKWAEMIFVDDINFPGGPNAFNVDGSGLPVPLAGNTVYILNLLFADGLLVRRYPYSHQRIRTKLISLALPLLAYIFQECVCGCSSFVYLHCEYR